MAVIIICVDEIWKIIIYYIRKFQHTLHETFSYMFEKTFLSHRVCRNGC